MDLISLGEVSLADTSKIRPDHLNGFHFRRTIMAAEMSQCKWLGYSIIMHQCLQKRKDSETELHKKG
jgi:hypothetical protein